MAIEITPQTRVKIPSWSVIVFIIELISLLILAISYLYFGFSSKKMETILIQSPQEAKLEQDITTKEKDLTLAKAKIDAFAQLLGQHQKVGNIFSFLEKASLPDIWFSNFDFSADSLTLKGHTKDFITLGQQILAFQVEPAVQTVKLSEILLNPKGGVDFSLLIKLNVAIFY